jgi:hypothetical protein
LKAGDFDSDSTEELGDKTAVGIGGDAPDDLITDRED